MSMDILLPIATYPDATSRVGLGHLLALSSKLGARVTAVIQEVDIPPVDNALGEALLGIAKMAADAEKLSRGRAANVRLWAQERSANLGMAIDTNIVRCRPEGFADCLLPLARYHDLTATVLDGNDPQRRAETEALIFGSGGPVLIVPALEAALPAIDERTTALKVVVAWDGGPFASRALRDAMPMLAHTDVVWIATVGDDKAIDPTGIAGVQAFLEHHGMRSKHLPLTRGTAPVGETLQAIAVGKDADLLVMGAYGHSRLQEFILGGATRTILHAPRLPILLSH